MDEKNKRTIKKGAEEKAFGRKSTFKDTIVKVHPKGGKKPGSK